MFEQLRKLFGKKDIAEKQMDEKVCEWAPFTGERLTPDHGAYIRKLVAAADKVDRERKVFGASTHKYKLRPTLTVAEIEAFETKYHITLPEEYVFFLTQVGNGGAGPYYGLTTLEKVIGPEEYAVMISNEALIDKKLTKERWQQLMEETDDADDDALFDEAMNRLYGGMLNIGTQGCTYDNLLMANGSETGKIVYIDWNLDPDYGPYLTNMTFLEWYENFFREIIQGNSTASYGYYRLGTEADLKKAYSIADAEEKRDILRSLYRFSALEESTLTFIQQRDDEELDALRLELLLKFDEKAAMRMFDTLLGGENVSAAVACARRIPDELKNSYYLVMAALLENEALEEKDNVIFFMKECDSFCGKDLISFAMDETNKENERKTAIWAISYAEDRMNYLNQYILWMGGESYWIAHAALQGMASEKHPRLVEAYYQMWERYREDQMMRSNLVSAFKSNDIEIEKKRWEK